MKPELQRAGAPDPAGPVPKPHPVPHPPPAAPPAPPPAAPAPTVDLHAQKQRARLELFAQYQTYQRGGGKLSLQDWLDQRVTAFLEQHPKAPQDAPPPAPPDEPGLVPEDPLGWILFGWETWTEGIVSATIKKAAESVVEWIIDGVEISPQNPNPDPQLPQEPTDGGVPPSMGIDDAGDGGDDGSASDGGDDGSAGGGCFGAGTLVACEDGGRRPIDQLMVGDLVVSRSEHNGETAARAVTRTWAHEGRRAVVLHLANGEHIEVTGEHRVFVADKGLMPVSRLQTGDRLQMLDGDSSVITGISAGPRSTTVYNLSVDGFRTYFVGQQGIWVHNVKDDGTNTDGGSGPGDENPDQPG